MPAQVAVGSAAGSAGLDSPLQLRGRQQTGPLLCSFSAHAAGFSGAVEATGPSQGPLPTPAPHDRQAHPLPVLGLPWLRAEDRAARAGQALPGWGP